MDHPHPARSIVRSGLCSVSFRRHRVEEIIGWAARAGLEGIEWGGDIHVPPGDLQAAASAARRTIDAGLRVSSYGSYWVAGPGQDQKPRFETVADTAAALGAPVIRVWAGSRDAREASLADRQEITSSLMQAAEHASSRGMRIALEFHDGSLTATAASAQLLLEQADHPGLRCYWQPPASESDAVCHDGLRRLAPWIEHLHVFHWWPSRAHRLPLRTGRDRWRRFLEAVPDDGRERFALLEFVPQDDPGRLEEEACALRDLLAETHLDLPATHSAADVHPPGRDPDAVVALRS